MNKSEREELRKVANTSEDANELARALLQAVNAYADLERHAEAMAGELADVLFAMGWDAESNPNRRNHGRAAGWRNALAAYRSWKGEGK